MTSTLRNWIFLAALPLIVVTGCGRSEQGPELAPVTGIVKLDGKPLPKALVRFQPSNASGSYSSAVTNKAGEFTLKFNRQRDGAIPGEHKVVITTGNENAEDAHGNARPVPEILPAIYHRDSILREEVTAGSNHIELELNSRSVQKSRRR